MLEVKNLSFDYNDIQIFDSIDIKLQPGKIVALVGPNGVGKTTFMRIVSGLLPIQKNTEIKINNISLKDNRKKYKEEISFMQANDVLYPFLTGYQHIHFMAKAYGKSDLNIANTISEFQLESFVRKKVSKYSLGMKQLLLFAMAYVTDTSVFLLDEPMNGLDQTNRKQLIENMLKLKEKNKVILLSTHLLDDIDKIADEIIFVKDGSIIYYDKNSEENTEDLPYLIEFDSAVNLEDFFNKQFIKYEVKTEKLIKVFVNKEQIASLHKELIVHDFPVVSFNKIQVNTELLYKEIYEETN